MMKTLKIKHTPIDLSDSSVKFYFDTVSKQAPISQEEEIVLVKRIHEGDKKAQDRLVSGNLRFVISIAKQYQNQGHPLLDLIEEGNIGLIKAAEKFDINRDNKFSSYAVWWIREAIQSAIQESGRHIRVSRNVLKNSRKVSEFQKRFELESGYAASVEEIAEGLNMTECQVQDILNLDVRGRSLDACIADDDEFTLLDSLAQSLYEAPDFDLDGTTLEELVDKALRNMLKERDCEIVRQFFGIGGNAPKSASKIGEELNLSRERVRQIITEALHKLRQCRYSQELRQCC